MSGPLSGVRIVEFAGIGPGPFCGMLLADMGADVLCVDSPASLDRPLEASRRGRRSVVLDLKHPDATAAALRLIGQADALLEGFRPGVMERLGLGPHECLRVRPTLVYCRITGWGQEGPLARVPGHDVNYISVAGALHSIGRRGEPPTIPMALVGDYGGGGMYAAFGVACGLLEARVSGVGQVIDAAMVDGVSLLMTSYYGKYGAGRWSLERGENVTDSGAPYYDAYCCKDGKYISVGAVEPQFYARFLQLIASIADAADQNDRATWASTRAEIAAILMTRTRDDWCTFFAGEEVCVAPVLSMEEAPDHPHAVSRGTFATVDGIRVAGPGPRFSRTPGAIRRSPAQPGQGSTEALTSWGFNDDEIAELMSRGVVQRSS